MRKKRPNLGKIPILWFSSFLYGIDSVNHLKGETKEIEWKIFHNSRRWFEFLKEKQIKFGPIAF